MLEWLTSWVFKLEWFNRVSRPVLAFFFSSGEAATKSQPSRCSWLPHCTGLCFYRGLPTRVVDARPHCLGTTYPCTGNSFNVIAP